ncbi:hypothetical protein BV898_11623 [Hypsibius exemplaris]|uniref:RRM domain-containing protein n=1 Tax=Hypsibius exemplaris TaxID=2072580 RepID=A0A1W0WG12_HYPEX|nr:hypothetical protein BV898_11623 [Hypsibius exemplaris]
MERNKPPVVHGSISSSTPAAPACKAAAAARCQTVPAKSLSAMDELYEQYVPPNPPWSYASDMGDHDRGRQDQLCTPMKDVEEVEGSIPATAWIPSPSGLAQSRSTATTGASTSHYYPYQERRPPRPLKVKRSTEKTDIPNRVFIGGLTLDINEDDMREIFGPYGELSTVYIKNRGGPTHRGFGFVTFKHRTSARRLVDEASAGKTFGIKGHELKVQPAFVHPKKYDIPEQPTIVVQQITPYYIPVPPIIRQNPLAFYPYPSDPSGVVIPYLTYYDGQMAAEQNYGYYPDYRNSDSSFNCDPFRNREQQQYSYLDSINAGCSGLSYSEQYPAMPLDECPECCNRINRPSSSAPSTTSDQTYCASCSCCTRSDQADSSTIGDDDRDPGVEELDPSNSFREGQPQDPYFEETEMSIINSLRPASA